MQRNEGRNLVWKQSVNRDVGCVKEPGNVEGSLCSPKCLAYRKQGWVGWEGRWGVRMTDTYGAQSLRTL